MAGEKSRVFGRKVFFLYPHSVVKNELIEEIVEHEYEVYVLRDHTKVKPIVHNFDDSILFINIDEQLGEPEWEMFIRDLMTRRSDTGQESSVPAQKSAERRNGQVRIGILSYNDDPELTRKYLMDLMIPCGFVRLRLGIDESRKILLKTLEANEARGRRRYVRASTNGSDRAMFNALIGGNAESGRIWDISVVGMAASFDNNLSLKIGTVLPDIQLKLSGILAKASGVVAATRGERDGGYLIMFGTKIGAVAKKKIHTFIHRRLQDEMNRVIKGFKS